MDPREKRRYDQLSKRSNNTLLTVHIRRKSLVETRYMNSPGVTRRQIYYEKNSLTKGHETNHSRCGSVVTCNRKQGYYRNRKICGIMALNDIFVITQQFFFVSN
jgi:hypothetical protein